MPSKASSAHSLPGNRHMASTAQARCRGAVGALTVSSPVFETLICSPVFLSSFSKIAHTLTAPSALSSLSTAAPLSPHLSTGRMNAIEWRRHSLTTGCPKAGQGTRTQEFPPQRRQLTMSNSIPVWGPPCFCEDFLFLAAPRRSSCCHCPHLVATRKKPGSP